jgi:hypothetical protein
VARTPEALDALLPQNLTNDDLKLETPKL